MSDGHVIIAVGNDGQFQRFCKLLGAEALGADPDFQTKPVARCPTASGCAPKSLPRWPNGPRPTCWPPARRVPCPAGPINTIAEMFADPAGNCPWLEDGPDRPGRHPYPPRSARRSSFPRLAASLRPSQPASGRAHRRGAQRTCIHQIQRTTHMKTGGQLIVRHPQGQWRRTSLYCVPGESYLAVLDALVDSGVGVHRLPPGRRRGDDGGRLGPSSPASPASASSPAAPAPPMPRRGCTSPARIRSR